MKLGSNYKGFEKSLDIDFKHNPPTSKQEMKILMMNLKYHVSKGEKEFPTKDQLDYAWKYINEQGYTEETEQKTIHFRFRTEYYGEDKQRHPVYRATENLKIGKKNYRKGQFLPRQR